MMKCNHVFRSTGQFYTRRNRAFGGQQFTVISCRECVHCLQREQRVVTKHVTNVPDRYERQLRFSGIKPENQMN